MARKVSVDGPFWRYVVNELHDGVARHNQPCSKTQCLRAYLASITGPQSGRCAREELGVADTADTGAFRR